MAASVIKLFGKKDASPSWTKASPGYYYYH